MSIKEQLVNEIVEKVVLEQAKVDGNSKTIDGQIKFHHLFVAGVERFRAQLADLPFHELEAQVQAGQFSMFDN